MKPITRRLFSRGSLAAPVALSTVTHGHPITAKEGVDAGLPLIDEDDEGVPWPSRNKVWKEVRKLQKKEKYKDRRTTITRALMGGLDPDIACLQSLPYTTQVRMQADRCVQEEKAQQGLVSKVAILFGFDPDKFNY